MIYEFKTGHWYKCVLTKKGPGWGEHMIPMLDGGKPHRCIKGDGCEAAFANVLYNGTPQMWNWRPEEFVEVDPPHGMASSKLKAVLKKGMLVKGFEFVKEDVYANTGDAMFYYRDVNTLKECYIIIGEVE